MINIYGIKNCDVVQKALKWLDAHKVPYTFHNYKETGLDKALLEQWLKHIAVDKLVNTRSTTFRELGEEEKAGWNDKNKAIALMMQHTSVVKRPVWDLGNGNYLLGWDEQALTKALL
ncbi:Spx/MgsR family RNA polymerase-binding regulatory protein [Nemorincola caseinilytica]